MYGWRGRLGLIVPYDNTVIEPEFARTLPYGVSAHVLRLASTDRRRQPAEVLALAPSLAHLRADAALFCNASAFIQGHAAHAAFLEEFRKAANMPATTAASAMIDLMRHADVRRVLLVTQYPQWILDLLQAFVTESGFAVAGSIGSADLDPVQINRLGPEYAYRIVKQADLRDADGVFVVATNLRTLEVLDLLQQELRRPVMSSNQALMWTAKRMLGLPADDGAADGEARMAWPEGGWRE